MNILFVCTGNTCRSPMAEAIMKHKKQDWKVQSAGIYAAAGSRAAVHAVQVLVESGIAIDHASKAMSADVANWADVIFTMTVNHKQAVLSSFAAAAGKVWTLKEFVHGRQGDVADPYGGSMEDYRRTYEELDELITQALRKLQSGAENIRESGHDEA